MIIALRDLIITVRMSAIVLDCATIGNFVMCATNLADISLSFCLMERLSLYLAPSLLLYFWPKYDLILIASLRLFLDLESG